MTGRVQSAYVAGDAFITFIYIYIVSEQASSTNDKSKDCNGDTLFAFTNLAAQTTI